jgi:hypothetical protein
MIPAPSLCGMIGEAISSPEAALRRLMSVGLMPDALMRMSASPRAGTGLGPLPILSTSRALPRRATPVSVSTVRHSARLEGKPVRPEAPYLGSSGGGQA